MRNLTLVASGVFIAASLSVGVAGAQSLRIGMAAEPSSADPHFHQLAPNNALARHIFDGLTDQDASQALKPGLATEWKADSPTSWTFRLREGVTFSNGKPFDANDVLFTFCRLLNNPSPTGSFTTVMRSIVSADAPDSRTLVITTKFPEPLLPEQLSEVAILSRSILPTWTPRFDAATGCGGASVAWPPSSAFNDGSAAIGTGPFALKRFAQATPTELVRNERHWRGPAPWAAVTLVPMTSGAGRLAGFLAGDLDVIENVSVRDLDRVKGNPKLAHVILPTTRVIFLQLDVGRADSPFVKADRPNPLKDVRVRQALAMAINRQAIVERILEGAATVADQFLPTGMSGTIASPLRIPYNPDRAKALLAEAGFPQGFGLTISTPSGRYVDDEKVAQAVAQFFVRIGVKAEVDAITPSVFFTRRAKREFSVSLGGWSSATGEASSFMRQFVATPDRDAGLGGSNYGGYSSAQFDAALRRAIVTVNDAERARLLQQAGGVVLGDMAYIPLHFESSIWAFRKGVTFAGRVDQYTLAADIRPER